MTRCDNDGVFYRVFCVTLLAIAFTFTVILTNVFIDIDGLLSSKEKEKPNEPLPQDTENNEVFYQPGEKIEPKPDAFDDFKSDTDDPDENYRAKRSLDSSAFQLHLKNPKMKQILTKKLSSLLEELDNEETKSPNRIDKTKDIESKLILEAINKKNVHDKDKGDDMLHLAMHNILLQGILGHMDLNEVYKKVHLLVKTFDQVNDKDDKRKELKKKDNSQEAHNLSPVESKFFEELVKCDELKKQIVNPEKLENTKRSAGEAIIKNEKKAPQMLIKTIIDIKTMKNDKHKDNKTDINEKNIKGLIKLIYNGRPIQFGRLEDEEDNKLDNPKYVFETKAEKESKKVDVELVQEENTNALDSVLDKAVFRYLNKYPADKIKSKRLKRGIRNTKVKVLGDATTDITPTKKDEDELYVEIETHFDSKGIKGEKKKKLIKDLVEKIQKAIHTNIDSLQDKKPKKKATQFKKRLQNPLELRLAENMLKNKILLPVDRISHRQSEPIGKTAKLAESLPKVADKAGNDWSKIYSGSSFLSNSKSINSGEVGKVDLDYSSVMKSNGIPQRLQKPLNTDNIESVERQRAENSNFYDLGDLKFYIKDFDGTGFSIGFNQYVGEVPDPESIKLFTGLQQLIKAYHTYYDETDPKNEIEEKRGSTEANHDVQKREVNRPKRPAVGSFDDGADYHSNEYKMVFENRYLPYDTYSELFEDQNKKVSLSIQKQPSDVINDAINDFKSYNNYEEDTPLVLDENLFKKPLRPSEIFGLADLMKRKKRSAKYKVQRYTNLKIKTKSKINRFINTDKMLKRFEKKQSKRSKRQIDKIRIIANDNMPQVPRHSDENVFVVSDENMFADRAVVRDLDGPDQEVLEPIEERGEYSRQIYDQQNEPLQVSQFSPQHQSLGNIFSARSRQNILMSKYPHLFLEEIGRSKEEENPFFYSNLMSSYGNFQKNNEMSTPSFLATPVPMPKGSGAYTGEVNEPKSNYKLTVKIIPKNASDLHSGFKEIHTSINKSISKNGVIYSSQVNVSEVSKIENVKDKNSNTDVHTNSDLNTNSNTNVNTNTNANTDANLRANTNTATERNNPTVVVTIATTPTTETTTEKATEQPISYFPLVKRIKEQQEKMKNLLRQHRKRIDDQLDTLKKEKQNIESIIVPEKKQDMIDVMLPLNPPQMLHLNKAEAGQLITSALMKLHDAPQLNDIGIPRELLTSLANQQHVMTTTSTTTTTTSTTTTPKPTTIEPDKLRLMKSIQRNENLTSAILNKIDRNTNLLQLFLHKLTERIMTTNRPENEQTPETLKLKDFMYPKDWKDEHIQAPFFNQPLPNLEVNKNATHVSIPFVYAYQQPFSVPNKENYPVASIVYQGHIHTNTNTYNRDLNKDVPRFELKGKEDGKKIPDIKREINQTRFFYDDLGSEYKLVDEEPFKTPNPSNKNRLKTNITKE